MNDDTITNRPRITLQALNPTAVKWLGTDAEVTLTTLVARADNLCSDVDRLAIQIERLVRERREIAAVLAAFHEHPAGQAYRDVLQLALSLNPHLRGGLR